MKSPDNTHLTAIKRKKISAPALLLSERGLVIPNALDYGCGYGKDSKVLGIDAFDLYGKYSSGWMGWYYKTILCTYVLNTISDPIRRMEIIKDINIRLGDGGKAYITVRNDKKNLKGYTKKKTWQGLVSLPLPILVTNSMFTIYVMGKDDLAEE